MRPKGHELGTFSKPLTLRTRETLVSEIRNQEQRAETKRRKRAGLHRAAKRQGGQRKGRLHLCSSIEWTQEGRRCWGSCYSSIIDVSRQLPCTHSGISCADLAPDLLPHWRSLWMAESPSQRESNLHLPWRQKGLEPWLRMDTHSDFIGVCFQKVLGENQGYVSQI